MKKRKTDARQHTEALLKETGQFIPDINGLVPRIGELSDYLLRVELEQERQLAARYVFETFGDARHGVRVVEMSPLKIYLEGSSNAEGKRWTGEVAISELLGLWRELPQVERPPHPLEPIIRAYWAHPHRAGLQTLPEGHTSHDSVEA